MDYKTFLTDNLPLVEAVVRSVARRYRMREQDAQDLLGDIQVKLIENDHEVLRRFEGKANLRTYLTTVTINCVIDKQSKNLGKWRPSLFARRAGPVAILLERYLTRDGLTFDAAVQVLKTNHAVEESEKELHAMSLRFPPRVPRRFVSDEAIQHVAHDGHPETGIERNRRAALADRTEKALNAALSQLGSQDRLLLRLYFVKGLEISKIVKVMQVEQKRLYRQKDRVLAVLRRELERLGLTEDEQRDVLGEDLEVHLGEEDDDGKS